MEGGDTNNSNFIIFVLKGIMDKIDPRKELFHLFNFDGAKVVRVAGEILELDRLNLTCMLCTLNGAKKCFGVIIDL